jgi:L-arabinose isomerase
MNDLKNLEIWFVTGSQHLYGEETLKQVAEHSKEIAGSLHNEKNIPVTVVFKPTVKSPEEIFSRFALTRICKRTVSASSRGCIPSPLPRCGSAD